MSLVFDIFQGIGIAAAVGVRPFLPALAVGALAAGDVEIDFAHTTFSFLQHLPFLFAMVIGAVLLAGLERRFSVLSDERGLGGLGVALVALAVGALFFAGALARGHSTWWPGLVGGVVCAAVGLLASRPLLARARGRLQGSDVALLPIFAEGAALIAAVVSVVAPPAGVVVLGLLVWLLVAGRARGERKYAGLRILR